MMKLVAVFGGSTLIFLGLAILMGVLPGIWLSQVPPGPGVKALSAIEEHGRAIYVAEGCAYCHTQQIRPLPVDTVFGRPSAPGDFAYQTPELLGSERTGPDLTNIGVRQSSSVWQYIHLYQPRSVVPQSIMPAFPWLFQVVDKAPTGEQAVPVPPGFGPVRGEIIPTEDAKALVAYLLSLKQPPLPGSQVAPAGTAPAAAATSAVFDAANGDKLFASTCAGCHGDEGKGVPGAFPPLVDDPVVNDNDPTEHIVAVLKGVHGKKIGGVAYESEMPAFAGQLADREVVDIIDHERSSWGNHGRLVSTEDVAAIRANKSLTGNVGTAPAAASAQNALAPAASVNAASGAKQFATSCAMCHGPEGKGVPNSFPPLADDPVVNGDDPAEHIAAVLKGVHGKKIGGVAYEAEMPAFAGQLSDQQVMEIVNYERTSWGNHAPPATVKDVATVRAKK